MKAAGASHVSASPQHPAAVGHRVMAAMRHSCSLGVPGMCGMPLQLGAHHIPLGLGDSNGCDPLAVGALCISAAGRP